MLKRYYITITALLLFCAAHSQDQNLFCEQLQALEKMVKTHHFKPKAVNDSLSTHVFDLFITTLDEDKRLFTQDDIDNFEADRYALDDYVQNKTCDFINNYITRLSKRIADSKTIISHLETEIFDYSGKDTLRFKPESKFNYFKDEAAAQRYWSKRMRYNILYTLVENDSSISSIERDFKTLEANLKPKLIAKEICKLETLENRLGNVENFVKEAFLNAYLHYNDPNSSFFTPTEKEMFENALSNDQLSFGIITAKNDNGDIVIAHITPGSAAFNDGNFEVNDIIKSLQSDAETLETYCVSNDDVLAFTSDQNHNVITFKIKKQDGSIKAIKLTKTKTKIEENTVSGYIIENKSKLGYINIPSFYSDFESPNGLGLANDVAKELYKLQKEHIEGLILDLRFNGGGSMKEAADLSGMFINRGPISILKYSNGETYTIRDVNRGSLFNKPIVVLVNNYSASASEFFAATMQDYNRALIVGARTHGKASAQVILPLSEDESLGYSKLTVEKFYRVTGQSHQAQGVVPDIILPNLYDGFGTQEEYEDFALQNDTIPGVKKYPKLKPLPISELRKKSQLRISNDVAFDAIQDLNQLILDNYFQLDTQYLLTLKNVHSEIISYRNQWQRINAPIETHQGNFNIKNSAFTKEVVSYNDAQIEINKSVLKDIKQDIYIEEAQAILQDLLTLNPSN
ncbi:carboxy terminal-processing peptidase [Psychroserpens sp. SPM9]|uniref:carboxy terminal-processing peptidase n=1 Tax=Psychroserpens sp. SPM9 TaxID=2975598 RepID=UPI0021A477EB|nr:carboxy terminal-processing peptidase [Psychroserpens sp. SPM9]MDG5492089.1 carboxy terminal-processing peptidase [Psychroserpens sp. SPM9]